ncbi:MAG: HAD family hydrolase [Proteobacteria bacterium]|nr:HAD family hydrolase [Pseudomonadota bacterium]MBU1612134.1 HAD family hydrolase [Pseudomonadota bacterium]
MIILNEHANPQLLAGVEGIIFDCDGVLIDSKDANTFYYNSYKTHFGLAPMTPEEVNFVHANHVWDSLHHILPKELYEAARQRKTGFDYREVIPYIRMEEGLTGFLQWARGAGLPLGIATSRTDTLDMVLSHLGLTEYFSPAITSLKVRSPKPHPESLWSVLDNWRMTPDQVVFIGDSSVDEGCALNTGVRFWSFKNPNLTTAQLLIPDFLTLRNSMGRAHRLGIL